MHTHTQTHTHTHTHTHACEHEDSRKSSLLNCENQSLRGTILYLQLYSPGVKFDVRSWLWYWPEEVLSTQNVSFIVA